MSHVPPATIDPVSIEDLDREILELSARMDAACYEQLKLIRQFDQRAGWLKWAFPNCSEWLAWRCDLSLSAAREKVRVSHALKTLPEIAAEFARGRLSYTKVRALTRVANRDNEPALVAFAKKTTATRVEERCRELRCGTNESTDDANRAWRNRSLHVHRDLARGTIRVVAELPLETGELFDKALDRARDSNATSGPESIQQPWAALQADALVTLVRDYLGNSDAASAGTAGQYQVTIHVDQSALTSGNGRSGLPVETVRRLSCDSNTVTIVEDENGQPLNVGRKSRTVPAAIKRALWARDRGCRFPGCHRRRFVDAHHVHHWSAGGATTLDNLVLLCSQHHRLVHEGTYRILRDYQDRWHFRRPDGVAVPDCGYRREDRSDEVSEKTSNVIKNPSAEGLPAGTGRPVSRTDSPPPSAPT